MPRLLSALCLTAIVSRFAAANADGTQILTKASAPPNNALEEEAPTTSPAPLGANDKVTAFQKLGKDIWARIGTFHPQWAIAMLALVLGLIMLIDGERVFKYLTVVFIAIFAYLVAYQEIVPGDDSKFHLVSIISSVEVALVVAIVCYIGYEGIKLLTGILLGYYIGEVVRAMLGLIHGNVMSHVWVVFGVYNACIILGVVLWNVQKIHLRLTALISSVGGAGLVTSSIAFFFMLLGRQVKWNTEETKTWVDCLKQLWKAENLIGIFGAKASVGPVSADFLFTLGFWVVLSCLGYYLQVKVIKKSRKDSETVEKPNKGDKRTQIGGVQEPLLVPEHTTTTDPDPKPKSRWGFGGRS